jgi:hypothetical protein
MNDQLEKFLQKAVAGSGQFLSYLSQDDRVPSTAETHLHGRCPIENADEYAGDP